MTFDDFLTHVLPYVPGCPDAVAVDHVVKAARTFCARTLVWNYTTNKILSAAGIPDYTLQIDKGQELVRLLRAEVDGVKYETPTGPYGRGLARRSVGNLCIMKGAQDFTLSPTPTLDGSEILTDIAVKPAFASTHWPDDFAEFVTDIAAGAVASLCLIQKQEWTDPSSASTYGGMFNARIGAVGMKVAKGLGTDQQRSRITSK